MSRKKGWDFQAFPCHVNMTIWCGLLGFSMGAALAIFSALTTQFKLAGVISMSGYLLGKNILSSVRLNVPKHALHHPSYLYFASRIIYYNIQTEVSHSFWVMELQIRLFDLNLVKKRKLILLKMASWWHFMPILELVICMMWRNWKTSVIFFNDIYRLTKIRSSCEATQFWFLFLALLAASENVLDLIELCLGTLVTLNLMRTES